MFLDISATNKQSFVEHKEVMHDNNSMKIDLMQDEISAESQPRSEGLCCSDSDKSQNEYVG